jgi:hypothetical protein
VLLLTALYPSGSLNLPVDKGAWLSGRALP